MGLYIVETTKFIFNVEVDSAEQALELVQVKTGEVGVIKNSPPKATENILGIVKQTSKP